MKFRVLLLVVLCSITFFTQAQTSHNPLYSHIPVDADRVYHLNYPAINSKLDWQSLAALMPPTAENKRTVAFLSDPASAGIDDHPGILLAETNILGGDSPRYTTILLALTDSTKYLNLIKGQQENKFLLLPGKPRTAREGSNTIYCWNDKVLVIVIVKTPKNTTPSEAQIHRFYLAALAKCRAALKGSDTNPFLTNPEFIKAFGDDADVHTWSHYGSGFGMMADAMRISKAPVGDDFLKAAEKVKNSRSHTLGAIRFDNGLVSLRSHVFYDSTVNFDFAGRPLNSQLIERLPTGNLLGLAAVHFDLKALFDLAQTQTKGKYIHTLDSILAKKNLTTKDILDAFKGDLVIAMIDSGNIIPATDTSAAKPGKPDVYLVATVNDPAAFAKVAASFQKKDSTAGRKQVGHTLRDNIFVLASSQQATDAYFDKPGRGPSPLVSDEFRSAPIAVAIDIKAISDYMAPVFGGPDATAKNKQVQAILGLFDQILLATAKTHGREMETLFEIKMADSKQNSLTTISQLLKAASGK